MDTQVKRDLNYDTDAANRLGYLEAMVGVPEICLKQEWAFTVLADGIRS